MEVDVIGDGLLLKLLLEGNEEIVGFMKGQPELFFEIESRLVSYINPDKVSTLIIRGLKAL